MLHLLHILKLGTLFLYKHKALEGVKSHKQNQYK